METRHDSLSTWRGMQALVERHDWARTPLGHRQEWPSPLKNCLDLCMGAAFPLAVWWGQNLVQIYNDPFRRAIGAARHGAGFGNPLAEAWPDIWPLIMPAAQSILAGEQACARLEALPFFEESDPPNGAYALSLSVVGTRETGPQGILAAFQEAVPWKDVDARRSILLALSEMRGGDADEPQLAERCCELMCGFFGMSGLRLIQVGEGETASAWPEWPPSKGWGPVSPFALSDFGAHSLPELRQGRACPLEEKDGGQGALAVPLLEKGTLRAVLVARRPAVRPWKETELDLLSELLERADSALVQARAVDRRKRRAREWRVAIEQSPVLHWRSLDEGQWRWSGDRWQALTGQSSAESRGWGWLHAFHPDDHSGLRQAWKDATRLGRFKAIARLIDARTGEVRWYQLEARLVADEWLGSCTDVDALRKETERQNKALDTMRQRVRATFALTRMLVRHASESAEGAAAEISMRLEGRIDAIARAEAIAGEGAEGWVALDYLVAEELAAHGAHENGAIRISGHPLQLALTTAQAVAIAVHELAAYSVGQGALSGDDGRVAIEWNLEIGEAGAALCFCWREMDVIPRAAIGDWPQLVQMERILAHATRARTEIRRGSEGLACLIHLPLDERAVWAGPPLDAD